jgi:hypothetical protein
MIVIPAWNTPEEVERDIPLIAKFHAYWKSLNGGEVPERASLDLTAVKDALPNVLLADIEQAPFRVRYRLVGTRIDEQTGFNLTGRCLDEFLFEPFENGVRQLLDMYERAAATGKAEIGAYEWSSPWPVPLKVPVGIFPLAIDGEITQVIAVEQAYVPVPSHQPKTWKEYWDIHKAGGPNKLDLLNYR